jgi:hypothetical protein
VVAAAADREAHAQRRYLPDEALAELFLWEGRLYDDVRRLRGSTGPTLPRFAGIAVRRARTATLSRLALS